MHRAVKFPAPRGKYSGLLTSQTLINCILYTDFMLEGFIFAHIQAHHRKFNKRPMGLNGHLSI